MSRRSTQISRATWKLLALLLTLALAAAIALRPAEPHEPQDDWGRPIAQTVAHQDSPALALHTGCRIAHPGSAPWDRHNAQGDEWRRATRQALMAMGLPLDSANQVLHKISMGAIDDVIGMGRDGATATVSRQAYRPVFSTTYMSGGRRVVCHDSRYVFKSAGRSEGAALYVVGDFHIAVFSACGNVSRVFPGPGVGPQAPGEQDVHELPEPGSVWLVLAALIGIIFSRRVN